MYIFFHKQLGNNNLVAIPTVLATPCGKHFPLLQKILEVFTLIFLRAPLNPSRIMSGCLLDPKTFQLNDELAEELLIVQHLI